MNEFKNVRLDFSDLDATETVLNAVADSFEKRSNPVHQTLGRALKAIIPAWIGFLRAEIDRQDEYGPGNSAYALTRVFALLTSLHNTSCAKDDDALLKMAKVAGHMFASDVDHLAKAAVSKGQDDIGDFNVPTQTRH